MSQHEDRDAAEIGSHDEDRAQDSRDECPSAGSDEQPGADASAARADDPGEPGAPAQAASDDPLARAEAEVARLTEALARNQAERVNHEKRLEREMDKARKFALERLMRDFVQVLDSLDQALAAKGSHGGGQEEAAEHEGLALTRKLALKVLESHGLETLDPQGQPFDANWHEAMTAVPSADAAPDTVLEVLQTGYALNGRLLRPARVVVAKAT